MTPRRKSAAIVVLASVAALVTTAAPSPASANATEFRDARRDTGHPADIVRVRVQHNDRVLVVVHHRNLTFTDAPRSIRVAYDTGKPFAGPEFYVRVPYQTDRAPDLRPARGWGTLHAAPLPTCRGERVRVSAGRDTTRLSVPRGCFGTPARVRVHVRLAPWPDDDRKVDVAPASRTMGPWVHR